MKIRVSVGGPGDVEGTIVLVDVYRSSTTITAALDSGAKYILPFDSVEQARKAGGERKDEEDVVMAGEKLGVKLDGFDLNITPDEMTEEAVGGKVIIYKSDNLTRVLSKCNVADNVIIGGFTNSKAVASYLEKNESERVEIVACGTYNKASIKNLLGVTCDVHNEVTMEDILGAGAILHHFDDQGSSDMALIAKLAYENSDWKEKISKGCIFRALRNLKIDGNVERCLAENQSDTVPVFDGKRIYSSKSEY